MIVDTSASVAIFFQEPGYEELFPKLVHAQDVGIGAPTLVECGIVLSARLGRDARGMLSRFLAETHLIIVPFEDVHYSTAVTAWQKFGKGRHPAALNFGDCLTYAVSKLAGRPLLCVGDGFSQTDVELAYRGFTETGCIPLPVVHFDVSGYNQGVGFHSLILCTIGVRVTSAMMADSLTTKTTAILDRLRHDDALGHFVDFTLPIPVPYQGSGDIRLIVLGQDPTVANPASRKLIKTTLNLDRNGSLRAYLKGVCEGLGIELAVGVYATNLLKNFFVDPPTQIQKSDIFAAFTDFEKGCVFLVSADRVFAKVRFDPQCTVGSNCHSERSEESRCYRHKIPRTLRNSVTFGVANCAPLSFYSGDSSEKYTKGQHYASNHRD